MIEYVKCHPEHLLLVRPTQAQSYDKLILLTPTAIDVIRSTMALSGFVGSRCVGAAGVVDQGDGSAVAWALLSESAGPYMLAISRKVRRVLSNYPAKRIEAWSLRSYEAGHRWIGALGFRLDEADTVDAAGRPASRYVFGGGVS